VSSLKSSSDRQLTDELKMAVRHLPLLVLTCQALLVVFQCFFLFATAPPSTPAARAAATPVLSAAAAAATPSISAAARSHPASTRMTPAVASLTLAGWFLLVSVLISFCYCVATLRRPQGSKNESTPMTQLGSKSSIVSSSSKAGK
jgi:hypothetical protein